MPRFNSIEAFDFFFGSNLGPMEAEYAGLTMLFAQAAPPPGWTKVTTYNDYALRLTSGTPSTGGSVAFSSVFNGTQYAFNGGTSYSSGPYPITVAPHTTAIAEMNSHGHTWGPGAFVGPGNPPTVGAAGPGATVPSPYQTTSGYAGAPGPTYISFTGNYTDTDGSGGGHTHPGTFNGVNLSLPLNFGIKYVDTILATYRTK